MVYIETKNPEVALTLMPWFLTNEQSREDTYLELSERLEENPDETFVCLVLDDKIIKLMAIAYCRYKDVFVWQARKSADLSSKMVDKVFDKLKDWARKKGFNRISTIPAKPKKVIYRRWGFEDSINNEVVLKI